MITILPADEAFLREVNAPADAEAMVLREKDGTVFGHALFRATEDAVEILGIETEEPLMTEGLIRAVLNAGDCRGLPAGVCRVETLAPVLERLEFVKTDNFWSVDIENFFRGGGCCGG